MFYSTRHFMRLLLFLLIVYLVGRRIPDLAIWGGGLLGRAEFCIDGIIRSIRGFVQGVDAI
jgi:hypothetical protein